MCSKAESCTTGDDFNQATKNEPKCNIRDTLVIGAITAHTGCPLDLEKSRAVSVSYFEHIGTESDHWRLTERQIMIQGGQRIYQIRGCSFKSSFLDSRAMMQISEYYSNHRVYKLVFSQELHEELP